MAYWVKKKQNSVNVDDDEVQQQNHHLDDDDEEDEFFGNQDDDDDDDDVIDRKNDCITTASLESAGLCLDTAEENANMNRFQNIGYHEEYDRHKELLLQKGFEDGYSQAFDVAYRIGTILGSKQTQTQTQTQQTGTVGGDSDKKATSTSSSSSTTTTSKPLPTIVELARIVRNHLTIVEQQQPSASVGVDDEDSETADEKLSSSAASSLHDLEQILLEKIKLREEEE